MFLPLHHSLKWKERHISGSSAYPKNTFTLSHIACWEKKNGFARRRRAQAKSGSSFKEPATNISDVLSCFMSKKRTNHLINQTLEINWRICSHKHIFPILQRCSHEWSNTALVTDPRPKTIHIAGGRVYRRLPGSDLWYLQLVKHFNHCQVYIIYLEMRYVWYVCLPQRVRGKMLVVELSPERENQMWRWNKSPSGGQMANKKKT